MKRYIIRSVGWIFDDYWYNFDGDYDVEGVHDTEEEALERKKYLNHKHFLNYFSSLDRFQLNYGYETGESTSLIDVKKILLLISNKLNISEEQILNTGYSTLIYDELITEEESIELVDEILKVNGFSFFRIIEFESEDIFFYQTKRNPKVWSKFYNKSMSGEEEWYYYFHLDGRDERRAVRTKKECYEYAINEAYSELRNQLHKHKLIKGKINELSATPAILENILRESKNIGYDNESIIFKHSVSAEELMMLDSVLINPILLLEKVKIEDLHRIDI